VPGVGQACWWLTPLYELLVSTVLAADKVFADETTLPVLDPGRGKTKTGRLWCYAVDDRPWAGPTHPAAAYIYSEDRRGEHPSAHLATFRGILQVDGYAGFGSLVKARGDGSIRLAFCWAHTGGRFTKSTLPTSHRSQRKCWHELASCMRSRPGSVVSHQMCVEPFVSYEAGRSSKNCTTGLGSTCRVCLDGQSWRRPCAMHYVTGTV